MAVCPDIYTWEYVTDLQTMISPLYLNSLRSFLIIFLIIFTFYNLKIPFFL